MYSYVYDIIKFVFLLPAVPFNFYQLRLEPDEGVQNIFSPCAASCQTCPLVRSRLNRYTVRLLIKTLASSRWSHWVSCELVTRLQLATGLQMPSVCQTVSGWKFDCGSEWSSIFYFDFLDRRINTFGNFYLCILEWCWFSNGGICCQRQF